MPNAIDIFISYAHADDEVPRGTKSGWVTTLVDELKKILRRKLGGSGADLDGSSTGGAQKRQRRAAR